MKRILSLFFIFLILPSAMQGMLRRQVGRPRAPQLSRQAPKAPRRSIVDVQHLKHVHNVIKPEYAHFSPLVGASLINSDYLKKVYQFAPNHPTTRLLNDPKLGLFHLQNTQFRDTQSLSMPGKSLNPELIGQVLGHLHTGQLNESQIQTDLIKQWKKTLHDDFKASISSEKLSQFLKLVQDSKNTENDSEKNRLYIPNMTEGILTGFLYRKATKKEELYTYLNALNKHVPILQKNLDEKMVDDNYSTEEFKKRSKKLKKFENDPDKQLEYIKKDFEGVLCTLMHQSSSKAVPPQILQSFFGYQDQAAVANCTECALQDVCNILLADSSTGLFNLKLLPSTITPIQEFLDFYTKYPSYITVNNPKVSQAWMDLLSNRNSIIYVQKNYEVECFADNILNLFNILFNIKAKSWQEFGQLLSDEHRTIACKEKIKGKLHTISFSISDNQFDLVIESGQHTYLHFPQRNDDTLDLISNRVSTSLFNKEDSSIYLSALVPLVPPPLYHISFEHSLSRYSLGYLASISENPHKIAAILSTLALKAEEHPLLREIIAKLFIKIPQDHHYLLQQAFKAIVESKAYELSKECLHFIKTYPHSVSIENLNDLLECCVLNPEVGIDQIKLLLDLGAKVSFEILNTAIKGKCNLKIIEELISKENNLEKLFLHTNAWGYVKESILAIAIRNERIDIANLLLHLISSSNGNNSLKFSLIQTNTYETSPLEYTLLKLAARQKQSEQSSYLKIIKKLIEFGAMSYRVPQASSTWIRTLTELLVYSEKENLEDVVELIKIFCAKADVNIANDIGDNTLSKIINCLRYSQSEKKKIYYYQMIALLLKAGATPTYLDNNGKSISALKVAIEIKDKKLEDLIRSHSKQ